MLLEPVAAATVALLPVVVRDMSVEDPVMDIDPVEAALALLLPVAVEAQVDGRVVAIETFTL